MKKFISNVIAEKKSKTIKYLKEKHADIVTELLNMYDIDDLKLAISCLMSNKDSAKCEHGNYYKIKSLEETRFCKNTCKCALESKKQKYDAYLLQLDDIQRRRISEKRKETNLKRYGVDNPAKSETVKQKIKETNVEKYGCSSHLSTSEIRERIKDTNIKRYGVDNPAKSEKIQEKIKKTLLEKYGVANPKLIPNADKKRADTLISKYGVDHNHKRHWSHETYMIMTSKENFAEFIKDKSSKEIVEKLGIAASTFFKTVSEYDLAGKYDKSVSSFELDVRNFLEQVYDGEIIYNARNIIAPLEVDIFLPAVNLAIECNGNYWHSEYIGNKDKSYHVSKTNLASEKGITLLHILGSEWYNQNDIVKSIISNKIFSNTRKIYARKTVIKNVGIEEARRFLNENHIQGYVGSPVRYGLYIDGDLVSIATFGKSRTINNRAGNEYELYRFCNKLGLNVIGGFSKLLKHFENTIKPEILITYADRRYFGGAVYEKNGFKLKRISKPNYWYFEIKNPDKLYHRYNFAKHRLIEQGHDKNVPEWEIMKSNGYDRIWDSGNLVYEKRYK